MMNSCIKVSALLVGFLCLLTSCVADRAEQTKVIAHRGYWKCEGSAQNSIRSLERAAEIGAYGSEFDVHLTADGILVVYHDNEIEGKNIQSSTYADLKDLTLSNGETLPTLENYLERAKSLDKLHLVFELKAHQTPERNREAAEASVDLVKKMGLEDRTDYISFNLDACKAFIRLCPDSKVFYLNGELSPKELKALGLRFCLKQGIVPTFTKRRLMMRRLKRQKTPCLIIIFRKISLNLKMLMLLLRKHSWTA